MKQDKDQNTMDVDDVEVSNSSMMHVLVGMLDITCWEGFRVAMVLPSF